MLVTAAPELPEGPDWMYEPKWDGFRAGLEAGRGRVVLTSRNGNRLDPKFPEIADAAAALPEGTVLDGEIVRWGASDRLDFDALQRRNCASARTARRLADTEPAHYIAFDALRAAGADLTGRPLSVRRTALEELLGGTDDPHLVLGWQTTDIDTAREWFSGLAAVGVEGIVAKDRRRGYRPDRTGSWVKVKHRVSTEAVVGGVVGSIARPRALILGRRDPATGELRIAGRTTVLRPAQAEQMGAMLRPAGPGHPWRGRTTAASWGHRADPVVPVEAAVVVEVAPDTAVTAGQWRHAVRYLRVRTDLSPADVPDGLALEA
jgi:ATP-dependent DNA ligase